MTSSSMGHKEVQGGSYLRTISGHERALSHRRVGRGMWNARMREIVKTWNSGRHTIPVSFKVDEPRKH